MSHRVKGVTVNRHQGTLIWRHWGLPMFPYKPCVDPLLPVWLHMMSDTVGPVQVVLGFLGEEKRTF